MNRTRILFGVLLIAAALLTLTSCEWFYALFGDPPTAVVSADPTAGAAPLDVIFDLSGSTAPAGVHQVRLDFGDGSDFATRTDLGDPIVHTYAAAGAYTAVLELTDSNSMTDHDTETIVVGEPAEPEPGPIAVLGSDVTVGDPPLIVSFDVSLSSAPDSRLVSYQLDFGDGTPVHVGTGFSSPIIHLYAGAGHYTAELTVIDAEGLTGTATLEIVATTEAQGDEPVARFDWTPNKPNIDQIVTFDADGSYDLQRRSIDPMAIVVYTWDFGDGSEAATTAETVEHTYTWPGRYDVTLTVYDDDGVAGTLTKEITVRGAIAYVTSLFDGTLSEIRLPSNTVSTAAKPFEWLGDVTIDPDGMSVYVGGASFVTLTTGVVKIRTSDHTLQGQADALDIFPFDIVSSPSGNVLYAVGGLFLFAPADELLVINPTTMTVIDTVTVQSYPTTIAFSPTEPLAYVVGDDPESLLRIDTSTHTVAGAIDLSPWGTPHGIAVTSNGLWAYVTLPGQAEILEIDLVNSVVANVFALPVLAEPGAIALTHDDAFAYVTDYTNSSVHVVDVQLRTAVDEILLDDATYGLAWPWDIAISPGDSVAVVPFGADLTWLAAWWGGGLPFVPALPTFIIDLDTNTVIDTVQTGFGPLFVDIWGVEY